MKGDDLIFVGIKGTAIALDRATGRIAWQTHLKGSGFVNLVLAGEELYATAQGEIFCLNPETGEGRWNNELRGYGWGLASIAVRGGVECGGMGLMAAEEQMRAEQASSAGAGAGAAS